MSKVFDLADAVAASEVEVFRAEFMRIASDPDALAAPCLVGRLVTDFNIGVAARRRQTGGEMLADAAEDANELPLAMGLLCRAALGQDVQDDARRLLARCAVKWADRRADI